MTTNAQKKEKKLCPSPIKLGRFCLPALCRSECKKKFPAPRIGFGSGFCADLEKGICNCAVPCGSR